MFASVSALYSLSWYKLPCSSIFSLDPETFYPSFPSSLGFGFLSLGSVLKFSFFFLFQRSLILIKTYF